MSNDKSPLTCDNHKHENYRWFFTNDNDMRGACFVNSMEYRDRTLINNLMYTKYYFIKVMTTEDSDIHDNFTDFIIKTALYHRELTKCIDPNLDKNIEEIVSKLLEGDRNTSIYQLFDKICKMPDLEKEISEELLRKIFADCISSYNKHNSLPVEQKKEMVSEISQCIKEKIKPLLKRTFSDDFTKIFFDNVYNKWDQMDNETRIFYDQFVIVSQFDEGDKKWKKYTGLLQNVNNTEYFRIDIDKDFINFIPDINPDFGLNDKIWYTKIKEDGSHETVYTKITRTDQLKQLYLDVYNGKDLTQEYPGIPTLFSQCVYMDQFQLQKENIIRERLEDSKKSNQQRLIEQKDAQIAKQKTEQHQSQLIKQQPMQQPIQQSIQQFPIQTAGPISDYNPYKSRNCNTFTPDLIEYLTCPYLSPTQLKPLYRCLVENDREQIKTCVDLYTKMAALVDYKYEEIMQASLSELFVSLEKIGLRTKTVNNIRVMETAAEWYENVSQNYPDLVRNANFDSTNNKYVYEYIDFMSKWINAHPEFLNPSMAKSAARDVELLKQQNEIARQMNAKKPALDKYKVYDYLHNPIPVQSGGHHKDFSQMMMSNSISGDAIERVFHHICDDLQRRGKTLDEKTLQKIKQHMETIKQTEQIMLQYINFICEYIKMLDVYGSYQLSVINEDKLDNAIQKYNNIDKKMLDRQAILIDIFQQIESKL